VTRLLTFFCAALLGISFSAVAADTASPDQLVKTTADEVLSILRTTKDKATLRKLAEQKVLPYFDFRRMTQLAVGPSWRQATPEQQKALEDQFRTLLVNTYTAALNVAAVGNESLEVKPLEMKRGDDDVTVRTIIRSPNRQPTSVDYRMSNTSAGWKVYDVVVENLSLVTNYRSSFASEIGRSGIDGLVKVLESKNRQIAQAG
jgi:phospholipid transport system substrate-binding protein